MIVSIEFNGFRKILCPVDFSSISDLALQYAGPWAKAFGSQIEVFHAEWVDYPRYFTEATMESLGAEREGQLESVRESLREKARTFFGPGIDWKVRVSEGHAIEAIRKRVGEENPDLIVLGSHGRSGMARLFLGSVTENVLHDIHCPALVVPKSEKGPGKSVQRIMCPVDFTDLSRECLGVASIVAERFGAHMQVFHSVEGKEKPGSKSVERLASWAEENLKCQCEVSSFVSQGNAAEQIVRTARNESVDLIVLAVRHRPFLEYSTIGTTTERVLRHSPCPVLTVQ